MERDAGMRAQTVQCPVQPPCRRVRGIGAAHRLRIVGINEDQIRGFDSGEMRLIGIHQKLRAASVNGDREMVSYAFMKIESRSPSKRCGEISSLGAMIQRGF